jgi:class 3 adenylate cyclase
MEATGRFISRLKAPAGSERVLATVLFTDIVGSTELAARLGDAAWRDLLARHHAIVRRELARFRGRELDTAGDGFFASFDGPARAVQAAAALREPLRAIGLEVRAGLHTGEFEASDGKVVGIGVSVGARISSLAGLARCSCRARSRTSSPGRAFGLRIEASISSRESRKPGGSSPSRAEVPTRANGEGPAAAGPSYRLGFGGGRSHEAATAS